MKRRNAKRPLFYSIPIVIIAVLSVLFCQTRNNGKGHDDLLKLFEEAIKSKDYDCMLRIAQKNDEKFKHGFLFKPAPSFVHRLSPGLHIAANKGDPVAVKLLLENGYGRPDSIDSEGAKPIHYAKDGGSVRILLGHGSTISPVDSLGRTPLHYAAMAGWESAAGILLKEGAPSDIKDRRGNTAMHLACAHGKSNSAMVLLQHGVAVNVANSKGETPLHLCAKQGNLAVCRALTDKGANPAAKTETGETPVHYAAQAAQTDILKILLASATPDIVNSKNSDGRTALHCAAASGAQDTMRLLLRNGANANLPDKNGFFPYDLLHPHDEENKRFLRQWGARTAWNCAE